MIASRATSRFRAAAVGALGGLVAAFVKLGWEVPFPPRPPDRLPEPAVFVALFRHVPTPMWQVLAVHFTFSAVMGILYALLVRRFAIVSIGMGAGFGIAVWIGAHEIVMPLIGLTPPVGMLGPSEQISEFFGHALWGYVIGVFCALYEV